MGLDHADEAALTFFKVPERLRARLRDQPLAVPAAIWPAVELFCALRTQWRIIPGAVAPWQGLDYTAVPVVLRLMGFHRREWAGLFSDLRVMEAAARVGLNEPEKVAE